MGRSAGDKTGAQINLLLIGAALTLELRMHKALGLNIELDVGDEFDKVVNLRIVSWKANENKRRIFNLTGLHNMIGLCRQHVRLWDAVSTFKHVRKFAREGCRYPLPISNSPFNGNS
jgi:hypothetical protein